tara:strand:+ start:197 stop:1012 length:816 start_codon:yes stop_codon:yes gene_type:complete
MVKKKNPPVVTPVSDPKLKKALEEASDIFSSRSEDYNQISEDIKSTEEFLRNKGLKDVFTCDFDRRNLQVMPSEYTSEGPFEYYREGLDWRFDHKSKKFRLMVTDYNVHHDPTEEANPKDPNPPTDANWYVLDTRPLIECPVQARVFYHPKLEKFISFFAETLKKHKEDGLIYQGMICLDIRGDGKKEFFDHIQSDLTCSGMDGLLVDEGVFLKIILPGGISSTPPRTTQKSPASKKQIEAAKEARKKRKQAVEAHEEWMRRAKNPSRFLP